MLMDRQGNPLSNATPAAVVAYDEAVHALNIYRGDPVALIDRAIAEAPEFVMAHIFKALVFTVATEPGAAAQARLISAHAKTLPLNDREASLIKALDDMLAGNWTAAALALDHHNVRHPHDIVALQVGHLTDFFRANARDLRDRIARILPRWEDDRPGASILLGLYAFGLEETGDYERAADVGRKALDQQPLDCWAHHAVAHALEMQGRPAEGVDWMRSRVDSWSGDDNFFQVHNWWHEAVFHLDLDNPAEALALYDTRVRPSGSAIALEMIDASALLWRLEMVGQNVGDRWSELATAWDAHADGKLYPFNDWHAAMAYLGTGREAEVERILAQFRANDADASEAAAWARTTGADLIEGFAAFRRRDFETAVQRLHRGRYIANTFGGSHAQRDVIDWTLTEAAVRGGMREMAEALAHERLALKPHSPVNQRFLARAIPSAEIAAQ